MGRGTSSENRQNQDSPSSQDISMSSKTKVEMPKQYLVYGCEASPSNDDWTHVFELRVARKVCKLGRR